MNLRIAPQLSFPVLSSVTGPVLRQAPLHSKLHQLFLLLCLGIDFGSPHASNSCSSSFAVLSKNLHPFPDALCKGIKSAILCQQDFAKIFPRAYSLFVEEIQRHLTSQLAQCFVISQRYRADEKTARQCGRPAVKFREPYLFWSFTSQTFCLSSRPGLNTAVQCSSTETLSPVFGLRA